VDGENYAKKTLREMHLSWVFLPSLISKKTLSNAELGPWNVVEEQGQ